MIHEKSLTQPDETIHLDHGRIELVSLPSVTIGRATFEPGWRWSTHVKPHAGTDSCQIPHTAVVLSGQLHVRMDDGTEADFGPGNAHSVPPGHDAWVVGDEPCIAIDIAGATEFADTARDPDNRGTRVSCHGCDLIFSAEHADQLDHLVVAVRVHALSAHAVDLTAEHIRSEMVPA